MGKKPDLGRIPKTIHLLRLIDDETYHRRILTQLNRGEKRHNLAREVFHGRRGELRQRYREGQEDQLDALGLVVNVSVLWTLFTWKLRSSSSELRTRFGYREFVDPSVGFRLTRWLYALCWTGTERPSVLFDRATAGLLANKVLLPGASVLERFVARLRSRIDMIWFSLSGMGLPVANVTLTEKTRS